MEFKVNRETISAAECVYEGIQEQGLKWTIFFRIIILMYLSL